MTALKWRGVPIPELPDEDLKVALEQARSIAYHLLTESQRRKDNARKRIMAKHESRDG